MIVGVIIFASCTSGNKSKSSYVPPASRTVATADEQLGVHNVCSKHMNVYAKNKFNTTEWRLVYVGDTQVAQVRYGKERGFYTKVNFTYGGGTVKMLCSVDPDFGHPSFSNRSGD